MNSASLEVSGQGTTTTFRWRAIGMLRRLRLRQQTQQLLVDEIGAWKAVQRPTAMTLSASNLSQQQAVRPPDHAQQQGPTLYNLLAAGKMRCAMNVLDTRNEILDDDQTFSLDGLRQTEISDSRLS